MLTSSDSTGVLSGGSNRVVIVIPVYSPNPTSYERASLQNLTQVLGHYPTCIVCPEGLDVSEYLRISPFLDIVYLDRKWFSSIANYSRLLLSPNFYNLFRRYEYLFLFQLDAWVFSDQLLDWCTKGYDYIGAPWFDEVHEVPDLKKAFWGSGNGGFSLRKIVSMLKVLHTFRYVYTFSEIYSLLKTTRKLSNFRKFFHFLKSVTFQNNFHAYFNNFSHNEDAFWGFYAPRSFSWYRVPKMNDALLFAFEKRCEESYAYLNNQLPFGCHKWWHPDEIEFWKQFIPFIESDEA